MASFRSNRNYKDISIKNIEPTNKELIDSNYGLKQFIHKTYLWTGGGIIGSTGIGILGSEIIQANNVLLSSPMPLLVSSIVLAFGGALGIGFTKYSIHKDIIVNKSNNHSSHSKPENYKILYSTNSIPRIISYGSMVSGMSLMMVPMCVVIPDALVPAIVASSCVFEWSKLVCYDKKSW